MPTANAMATYSQARGDRPSTDLRRPDEGGGTGEDIRRTGSGGSPHSGIATRRQSPARHAIIAPSAHDTTPAMLDPSLLRQDPAALAERLRATRGFDLDDRNSTRL